MTLISGVQELTSMVDEMKNLRARNARLVQALRWAMDTIKGDSENCPSCGALDSNSEYPAQDHKSDCYTHLLES